MSSYCNCPLFSFEIVTSAGSVNYIACNYSKNSLARRRVPNPAGQTKEKPTDTAEAGTGVEAKQKAALVNRWH